MARFREQTYTRTEITRWPYPNYWDAIALILVLGGLILLGWGAKQMAAPYHPGEVIPISLNPIHLPYYALRSVLRMFIALICSLLFTLVVGTWAAKSRRAERIIIPLIDVLQSVPVLGFLTITVVVLVALFPHSLLGAECASIFAIFTAQVWNITLSFYQSLKTVPQDLIEASDMFHLSAWQRFWKVDVAFAMPGLIWNTMMSMSASWVFVVASEAISVGKEHIRLPGIGSYIALAVQQANKQAVLYVIIAMFFVILLYDQLLFRPLLTWAEKFKPEETEEAIEQKSWLVDLFAHTQWFKFLGEWFLIAWDGFVNNRWLNRPKVYVKHKKNKVVRHWLQSVSSLVMVIAFIAAGVLLVRFVVTETNMKLILHVFYLGFATLIRVLVLIFISSLIWVPIGVWIGRRPRVAKIAQPIIQFFAAFPAILLFPIVVMAIVKYNLNVNVWTSPLMILGTQWYILFNVIAGASVLPKDLYQASSNLGVTGWLWWKRLMLPGIFPYFVTGAITAAGGAWNISIVAEAVSWGKTHLYATGLGAYITQSYNAQQFSQLTLGIVVMSIYVLIMNRIIWRPLYRLAEERFVLT